MEIHQLRYFVAVAQERHFQRAAERVHISQPTLSQQIQKLERELGVLLVERSPRQVKLTAEGEKFLSHAISILETMEKAAAEVHQDKGDLSGRVQLGVIPTIGPYLLPPVIRRLRKDAPGIVLELHDLTTSSLIQHLKEGRIQMGLLALPIQDKSIASQSIGNEPFFLAVPEDHRLARKRQVTTRDFSEDHLLVLQEGHCFRQQSLEYCKLASNSPRIIFQGSSLSSVMRLTAAGEGLTFVPKIAALPKENPGLKFIPFVSPAPTRDIGIIWRMSAVPTRAQKFLIDVVEGELQRLIGSR
jgi:LysR family hydrogen peroxide-inducible transcriptional activator